MPTIGEVYNPLITARNNQAEFDRLLRETGKLIFENNRDRCQSIEDGIAAAKHNLDYYCQYFDDKVAAETRSR